MNLMRKKSLFLFSHLAFLQQTYFLPWLLCSLGQLLQMLRLVFETDKQIPEETGQFFMHIILQNVFVLVCSCELMSGSLMFWRYQFLWEASIWCVHGQTKETITCRSWRGNSLRQKGLQQDVGVVGFLV